MVGWTAAEVSVSDGFGTAGSSDRAGSRGRARMIQELSLGDWRLSATNPLRRQRLYSKEKPTMLTLLVNIIATIVLTVVFVFRSLALLSAVIMAVAGIGNLLSGVLEADDNFSPVA